MMKYSTICFLVMVFCAVLVVGPGSFGEPPLGQVALHQALLDVGTDLRLMCVAAHPDDEDGATLSMYRKKYGYKTFALIATRGEGGQNEIGPELYNELGVIRTHEMKAASAITGAELHFLDMPEFGFSKNAEEAFSVWGKNETLRRLVKKIRETRPDVIITHHGTKTGHGHHRAVGITLLEAFDAAADPGAFPEQLAEGLKPWQASRFYVRSFRGAEDGVRIDISLVDEARGYTYAEIAGQALFEHESQGMGMFVERFLNNRSSATYQLRKSATPSATKEGSVPAPGGGLFDGLMDRVTPQARRVSKVGGDRLESKKAALALLASKTGGAARDRANRLAVVAMQLTGRAKAGDDEVVPGQTLNIEAEVFDFGEEDAKAVTFSLESADWMPIREPAPIRSGMVGLRDATAAFEVVIPEGQERTIPHPEFLFHEHFLKPQFTVVAKIETDGPSVELRFPVLIDIAPAVSAEFLGNPFLLRRGHDKQGRFEILVTNHAPEAREYTLELEAPKGIRLEKNTIKIAFKGEGGQRVVPIRAEIDSELEAKDYTLTARVKGSDTFFEGTARMANITVPRDIRVGVIQSYDTTFMETLEKLDVPHEALTIADYTPERLDAFTTIIVDIRAYLVRPDLVANNDALLDYVHRGGTVIVNYHKTFEWKREFAPYPITLSRNRVTVEDAPIEVLVPNHPLFTSPNAIGDDDWKGWKQERGLYFPSRWDDHYTPLIQCADPGENPPPGSCLITDYGKGTYMYTALGWYRQLRELHPGTLRIFANMLAL